MIETDRLNTLGQFNTLTVICSMFSFILGMFILGTYMEIKHNEVVQKYESKLDKYHSEWNQTLVNYRVAEWRVGKDGKPYIQMVK